LRAVRDGLACSGVQFVKKIASNNSETIFKDLDRIIVPLEALPEISLRFFLLPDFRNNIRSCPTIEHTESAFFRHIGILVGILLKQPPNCICGSSLCNCPIQLFSGKFDLAE
jgi:hypothetical protein